MTTFKVEERTCAVCGEISKHRVITSTSAFGSMQLDTRPPYPQGASIDMWIQRCPSCGYCAPDIFKGSQQASNIIKSEHYQKQLGNPNFPELANSFLCWSLIQESTLEFAEAAWSCIHAAWACDDASLVFDDAGRLQDNAHIAMSAQNCRTKALASLQRARERGQRFAEQEGGEEILMVDLARRSGQFDLALHLCEEGLAKNPENIIKDILQFERVLISRHDTRAHTVKEASPNS